MFNTHFLTSSQFKAVDTIDVVDHPHFIQFMQDDKIIGEISATFNFSQLPGSYHIFALQLLTGHRCIVPSTTQKMISKNSSDPWWKFW